MNKRSRNGWTASASRRRRRTFACWSLLVIVLLVLLVANWHAWGIHQKEADSLRHNSTKYWSRILPTYQWIGSDKLIAGYFAPGKLVEADVTTGKQRTVLLPSSLSTFRLPNIEHGSLISPSGEWLYLEAHPLTRPTHRIALFNLHTGQMSIRTENAPALFLGWLPDNSGWASCHPIGQALALITSYRDASRPPVSATYRQSSIYNQQIQIFLGVTSANEVIVASWNLRPTGKLYIELMPLSGARTLRSLVIPIPAEREVHDVAFCPSRGLLAIQVRDLSLPSKISSMFSDDKVVDEIWITDLTGKPMNRLGSMTVVPDTPYASNLTSLAWDVQGAHVTYTLDGLLFGVEAK